MDISEETIHTATGAARILAYPENPYFDDGGKPRYLLGISADVTERRRAEEQIKLLNAGLEAARAHQLAAANTELEGFSYSVSHRSACSIARCGWLLADTRRRLFQRLDDEGAVCWA